MPEEPKSASARAAFSATGVLLHLKREYRFVESHVAPGLRVRRRAQAVQPVRADRAWWLSTRAAGSSRPPARPVATRLPNARWIHDRPRPGHLSRLLHGLRTVRAGD